MQKHNVKVEREGMLNEAEKIASTFPVTASAIVTQCICLGVDELDKRNTLLADIENYSSSKRDIDMSRLIYEYTISQFPNAQSVWEAAINVEKTSNIGGDKEHMLALLQRATESIPNATIMWLMAAKEVWQSGDVDKARYLLQQAFSRNPDSEAIWLAAVKVETESQQVERARILLQTARQRASSARVYMKSAKLERIVGNRDASLQLINEGIKLYPNDWKLQLMLAQHYTVEIKPPSYERARDIYRKALSNAQIASQATMWICYARMELLASPTAYSKARSILETGRHKLSSSDVMWLESIRVERLAANQQSIDSMLSRALQQCPTSGILWSHAIEYESAVKRKARSFEALKRCTNDVHVFTAVARLFWHDRKISKARSWFERAVNANQDIGDAWAYYYKFEAEQQRQRQQQQQQDRVKIESDGIKHENGTAVSNGVKKEEHDGENGDAPLSTSATVDVLDRLLKRIDGADPSHGELWTTVSKQDRLVSLKPREIAKLAADSIKTILPH